MGYSRGERMKLQNSLSPRDKRRMSAALTAAQEAVEAAEEARDKVMGESWAKGLSLGAIQGAVGIGYQTVQNTLRSQGLDVDPE